LIASYRTVEEICREINADSLAFLSEEGFVDSVGGNEGAYNRGMCLACFDNDYPTPVNEESDKSCSC